MRPRHRHWLAETLVAGVMAIGLSQCDSENLPETAIEAAAPAPVEVAFDASDALAGAHLTSQTPSGTDFGTVNVGQQSTSIAILVVNDGVAATGAISVAIADADAASFGIDEDGCTDQVLAPGGSCGIYLHFTPAAAGPASATLAVHDNAGDMVLVPLTGTGATSGALLFMPTTAAFGPVAAGSSSPGIVFVLTNSGAASGPIASAIIGTNATDFAIANDTCAGQSLDMGATCSVTVVYEPSALAAGDEEASLTATAGGVTAAAGLSGTPATPAALSVSPAPYDFGAVPVGGKPVLEQFVATNQGGVPSAVPVVSIVGTNASDFVVTANGCALAVMPAATCTISVVFTPSIAGAESATLSVASGGTSASAALAGTGLVPAQIQIAPGSDSFAATTQGASSSTMSFVVTNHGGVATGPLTAGLLGTEAGQFYIDHDACTATALPAGKTCAVTVHFAPTAGTVGAVSASLEVSGSPGGQTAASLTGVGVAPAQLAINSTNQGFGTVTWGSASPVVFTVTNTGGAASGTIAVSLTGSNATAFALGSGGCAGVSLAGGGTCTIAVNFAPSNVTGLQNATLSVTAAPGGSKTATLTGTAQQPATLTIAPPAGFSGFGSVAYGTKSVATNYTVTNGGGATTGTLTTSLGGGDPSQFTIASNTCSQALAPQQSCVVAIEFSPTTGTVGTQQATLTVSATPGGSAPASLAGTAAAPAQIALAAPSGFSGFGTAIPPATSATATFTVTNNGGLSSGALTVALSGTGAAQYTLSQNTCASMTLSAGASCTVVAQFTPQKGVSGTQRANLTASATPGGNSSVTLSSSAGNPAKVTLAGPSGSPADFGSVTLGQSSTLVFSLGNTGDVATGTPSIAVSGTNAADFAITANECTAAVGADESCTVSVTFTPSQSAAETATLTATASPGGIAVASIQGTGVAPPPPPPPPPEAGEPDDAGSIDDSGEASMTGDDATLTTDDATIAPIEAGDPSETGDL
jgi:hypothetical protein